MTDKFYTNNNIAKQCLDILYSFININDFDLILEPSAGNGSFYNILDENKKFGIDIQPDSENIIKMDFFEFKPIINKKYLVIGNPPFGKNSSLAIKFFNKASQFANCIAFIIPKTFKRVSVQNQLDLNFELIHNYDLPLKPCCFTPKMMAKCCFQIWIKSDIKRTIINYDQSHNDFSFIKYGPKDDNNQPTVPDNNLFDFAMKAYGSNCGKICNNNFSNLRPKSWHFIKCNIDISTIINRFESLDYSISKDTVRQDSLGQKDLIFLYKNKFN